MGLRDSQCDTVRAIHIIQEIKRSHNDLDLLLVGGLQVTKARHRFQWGVSGLLMTCLLSGLALVNPRIVKGRLFLKHVTEFLSFFFGTCFDV